MKLQSANQAAAVQEALAKQGETLAKQTEAVQETLAKQGETLAKQGEILAKQEETLAKQTAAIDGFLVQCDMSGASRGHQDLFKFTLLKRDPPMVPNNDSRVHGLVQVLRQLRDPNRQPSDPQNEKECRDKCIIPFFQAVAQVYRVSSTEPNSPQHQLKVVIGNRLFSGYTDFFVGGEEALINEGDELILMIEMKPMEGGLKLSGNGFLREKFAVQAQIALQGVAIQSCCTGLVPFACILTNLHHMYVLQVTSYDSLQITAKTFKCVSDETKFVRAVLKAADTNKQIQKQYDTSRKSIMCVTKVGYDSRISSLALGGIPQTQASIQGAGTMGAASHGAGGVMDVIDGFEVAEADGSLIADDSSTLGDDSFSGEDLDNRNPATSEELCTWRFAKCLQPDGHSRTYTQVWVQKLQQ